MSGPTPLFAQPRRAAGGSGMSRVALLRVVDLSGARIVAADANGDQAVDLPDIKHGDRVLVQARLPKRTAYAAPAADDSAVAIVGSRLVDQSNQLAED